MLGTGWQWEKIWESWGQQDLPTPLVTPACRVHGPLACRSSHRLHVTLSAHFCAQGAGIVPDAWAGVHGKMDGEWAAMVLDEMMSEQGQAAATGATLERKRSQSNAWKQTFAYMREAERDQLCPLVHREAAGVENEFLHSLG